ncbi:MAG: SDR family oxidoreductase [Bryobacteraceae bacterium]
MLSQEPLILLTGGTGLIGGSWLASLASSRPECRIAAMARQPASIPEHPNILPVAGDLAADGLGIAIDTAEFLRSNVSEIIHCAADIRFSLPLEQARAVNTEGTRKLLFLARECSRLRKFAHLSTVYIAGKMQGRLPEAPVRNREGFLNSYQQTKYEAEQLVLESARDLPAAVFRVSSVIGDSRSGRVRQFNYFHQLIRLIPHNVLPVIPGDPESRADLIASDWLIPALNHVYEKHFQAGAVYNFCSGEAASMSVHEMLSRTYRLFAGHRRNGGSIPLMPELVSSGDFDRYAAKLNGRDGKAAELVRVLSQFMPQLCLRQTFENSRMIRAVAPSGIHLPDIRDYYDKVITYCLETEWGRLPERMGA